MTSNHWKDKREAEEFSRRLEDYQNRFDPDLGMSLREEPAQWYLDDDDAKAEMFENWPDDPSNLEDSHWGLDDWDPYDDPCWHYRERRWLDDNLGHYVRSGWHVKYDGSIFLVLESGRWADLMTGKEIRGRSWVDEEDIVFGR